MDDHHIITEYLTALDELRSRQGQPFARTMRSVPDESGIYMLSDAEDVTELDNFRERSTLGKRGTAKA